MMSMRHLQHTQYMVWRQRESVGMVAFLPERPAIGSPCWLDMSLIQHMRNGVATQSTSVAT